MKNATDIIKEKLKDKKGTKKMKKDKKVSVSKQSDSNLVIKKYLELIKKSKTSEKIQLNDQQVLSLGFSLKQNLDLIDKNIKLENNKTTEKKPKTPRKSNLYLLFMKEFKKKNSGKFDIKSIMKEGAKA